MRVLNGLFLLPDIVLRKMALKRVQEAKQVFRFEIFFSRVYSFTYKFNLNMVAAKLLNIQTINK